MTKASVPSSTSVTSKQPPAKFRRKPGDGILPPARSEGAHAAPASQRPPEALPDSGTVRLLHESLLTWYARERRDLPWRRTRDPYAIWLSEVMLQQTRVDTVIPYYERFLSRWPTVGALAEAPIDDVLAAWSGLGYYRRARMLHAAAQAISDVRTFPPDAESLARIKGIGRYTAGAVASIAYGEATPLVDGNVARVFARLFAIDDDVRSTRGIARLWTLATHLVEPRDPGAWNQALMELGATVCTPRDPRCLLCPVARSCRGRALGVERELPRLKAKPKPREQRRWALVATRKGAVLLGQRRPDLRFGGLWEPPTLDVLAPEDERGPENDAQAASRLASLAGVKIERAERGPDVTHVLSHRRLEIAVLCAELSGAAGGLSRERDSSAEYAQFALVDPGGIEDRGVSTLARKILAAGGLVGGGVGAPVKRKRMG